MRAQELEALFEEHGWALRRRACGSCLFMEASVPLPSPRPGAPDRPNPDIDGPCLLWTGARTSDGYGAMKVNGRPERLHRIVFEAVHGPIPEGMDLGHRCERRLCINPDHVRPVTHQENGREGSSRRWPDSLLLLAPPRFCKECGARMQPSVSAHEGALWRWKYQCSPCGVAYRRARRDLSLPPRTYSGQASGRMHPEHLKLARAVVRIQSESSPPSAD